MARSLQRRHRQSVSLTGPPSRRAPPAPDNVGTYPAITPFSGHALGGRPTTRSASPRHKKDLTPSTPAVLSVNAADKKQGLRRGQADPDLPAFSGYVNGDTAGTVTVTGAAACNTSPPTPRERGHLPRRHHLCPGHPRDPANYTFATGDQGQPQDRPPATSPSPRTTARAKVYGAARAESLTYTHGALPTRRHRPQRLPHRRPGLAAAPPRATNVGTYPPPSPPLRARSRAGGQLQQRSASPPARPYAIHPGRALEVNAADKKQGLRRRPSRPRPTASAATSTATPPARSRSPVRPPATIAAHSANVPNYPDVITCAPGTLHATGNYTFATGTKGNLKIHPADADRHPERRPGQGLRRSSSRKPDLHPMARCYNGDTDQSVFVSPARPACSLRPPTPSQRRQLPERVQLRAGLAAVDQLQVRDRVEGRADDREGDPGGEGRRSVEDLRHEPIHPVHEDDHWLRQRGDRGSHQRDRHLQRLSCRGDGSRVVHDHASR